MRICPVNREWIHDHVMEPYLQGAELLKMAWQGVDRSLKTNPLDLKERAIYWLQGASLMIPFINTIIWIAWQTFGTPEKLFDPFCPETAPPPAPPTKVIIHHSASSTLSTKKSKPPEIFIFVEKEGDLELQMKWKLNFFKDKIEADQQCQNFLANSIYRPEDWSLKEYSYQMGATTFKMWQEEDNRKVVHATLTKEGVVQIKKTFPLLEEIPVIQHRAIGLRPFILSEKKEMDFYAVVPEIPFIEHLPFVDQPPLLMKAKAKKIGLEETEFGLLVKVEIIPDSWIYRIIKCEMWFDPQTGVLKKFIDSGKFIQTKSGELVRSNLSRE